MTLHVWRNIHALLLLLLLLLLLRGVRSVARHALLGRHCVRITGIVRVLRCLELLGGGLELLHCLLGGGHWLGGGHLGLDGLRGGLRRFLLLLLLVVGV